VLVLGRVQHEGGESGSLNERDERNEEPGDAH